MHGSRQFAHVILTQDWHPPGHSSFAGAHPGQHLASYAGLVPRVHSSGGHTRLGQICGDVNQYLKTWKVPENTFTQKTKVTLRELLTHTAGMAVHGFPGYVSDSTRPTVVQVLNGEKPANTSAILGNDNAEVLPLIELDLSKLPKGAPRIAGQDVKFDQETEAFKVTKSAPAEDLDE